MGTLRGNNVYVDLRKYSDDRSKLFEELEKAQKFVNKAFGTQYVGMETEIEKALKKKRK